MNEAIQIKESEPIEWTPKEFEAQIANETKLREILLKYVKSNMRAGHHYYEMQGKNSLSKEGALNLCSLFKVKPEPRESEVSHDGDHISVFYRVDLISLKTGRTVATGDAMRTSKESKFRRQNSNDMHNTVLKMAFKSALIAAALQLPIISELFSQDEYIEDEKAPPVSEKPAAPVKPPTQTALPVEKTVVEAIAENALISKSQEEKLQEAMVKCVTVGSFIDKKEAWDWFKNFAKKDSLKKVLASEYDELMQMLRDRYSRVPANQAQKDEMTNLLESLVKKELYRSPSDATQDFEKTFGKAPEHCSYLEARKAIAALTAQVAGG